jgi:CheY-like chemotaxis protein
MPGEPKLLIVDDSSENRLLLKVFLKNHPLQVDEAVDGAEAVERATATRYTLVLMDVHMPVMDGLEATRRIRALERTRGLTPTPILALTADDTEQDRQRSLDAGCDGHLVKPVSRATLQGAVRRWI